MKQKQSIPKLAALAVLIASCTDSLPDLPPPCEGGYYDIEMHSCRREAITCEGKDDCVNIGGANCAITSATEEGHTYKVICEGERVGFLDNGKPGEKGESGLDGTNGEDCSIASTSGGVEITCGTLKLPISDGTNKKDGKDGKDGEDGKDGKDGKDGTNGENCSIAQTDAGVEITCGTVKLPISHGGTIGATGAPGDAGKPGANGEDCTIEENEDKDGVVITCGKVELQLSHGKDSGDGTNGANGKDCTIIDMVITCGTVELSLSHGTDGKDGEKGETGDAGKGCTIVEKPDIGVEITCGTMEPQTLRHGTNGTNGSVITIIEGYWYIGNSDTGIKAAGDKGDACKLEDEPGDSAYLMMTCGTDDPVTWPKAMCLATAYDPEKQFCDSDYNVKDK